MQNQHYQTQINQTVGQSAQTISKNVFIYAMEGFKFLLRFIGEMARMVMGK
jgi:hypothetical protein